MVSTFSSSGIHGMDAVTVSVEDSRAGRRFEVAVDHHRALDALYHPFAYAA
jgi:hypothetical protein